MGIGNRERFRFGGYRARVVCEIDVIVSSVDRQCEPAIMKELYRIDPGFEASLFDSQNCRAAACSIEIGASTNIAGQRNWIGWNLKLRNAGDVGLSLHSGP